MADDFGDRMKMYEGIEAQRRFIPRLPIVIRLDGRGFSNFTRDLRRPYDPGFSDLMIQVTKEMMRETGAIAGYTQSDEISLILHTENYDSQLYFDGRIQKVVSSSAAMATALFGYYLGNFLPSKVGEIPTLDSRAWNTPNQDEAVNALLWREQDATKNSISMAARHYFSHKELQDKKGPEMIEMLYQKGIKWQDYPAFFKRGTFLLRRKVVRAYTKDELEKLPAQHEARKNPDLKIERSEIKKMDMPPFGRVTNRVGVIFNGEEPQVLDANDQVNNSR